MAKHEFFKAEFDKLATRTEGSTGAIGDPHGAPAYAYIRVSSDEQGEEGRSGLPRQLEHIHERALASRRRIPWDMVFADDYTGFELERPELTRLRDEYRSPRRRANAIVMEHLDRLSRNADWHQGYLLEEMKKRGIEPLFWKAFTSRIERVVMGTIAQDAMELTLERMAAGTRKKAESGRVTARTRAYGYKFVDEHGNETDRARKMTHYAIHEDEAAIMRQIYARVVAGDTMIRVAADLARAGVQPPGKTRAWLGSGIRSLITNPVYKGEFIAHRYHKVRVEERASDGYSTRIVKRTLERPESEWIRVQVPAIVDAGTWQAANDMLAKNRAMAARNASRNNRYLLTSLIRCADCGGTYVGKTYKPTARQPNKKGQLYRCRNTYAGLIPRYAVDQRGKCSQGTISTRIIEAAVWAVICDALLQPDVLLAALEANTFNDRYQQAEAQIEYLQGELTVKAAEDDKLYRAYLAGVFDETEYAERRALLKAEAVRLAGERDRLVGQRVSVGQFEAQKQTILDFSAKLQSVDVSVEPPFEVKQRILKMTVHQIIFNQREKWFRLEGMIRGEYVIENKPVYKPAGQETNLPVETIEGEQESTESARFRQVLLFERLC